MCSAGPCGFLQIILPLLKILLLVVFLSALPGVSQLFAPLNDGTNPNAVAFAVVLGVLGGIGGVFAGYFMGKRVRWLLTVWPKFLTLKPWPWTWALSTLIPGTAGGLAGYGATLAFSATICCLDPMLGLSLALPLLS